MYEKLYHTWRVNTINFFIYFLTIGEEERRGFTARADRKTRQSRVRRYRLSIVAIIRLLSGTPPFPLERSVSRRQLRSNERASERIEFIISANTRARITLAISPRKTRRRNRWKRRSDRHSWKRNDRAPKAPFRMIIARLPRSVKCTFDRASISRD